MSQEALEDAIRSYWKVRAAQAAKRAASGRIDGELSFSNFVAEITGRAAYIRALPDGQG